MPDKAEFTNGYALLIGVGRYKDEALDSVPATAKDAEDIYSTLIDPNVCAYPKDQVHVWTNEDATKKNIIDTLNHMKDQVPEEENSTVIIFFSGHGCLEEGEYYFLPHETVMTRCNGKSALNVDTALANKDFLGIVRQIHARRLVILLNTCYAGGAGTPLSPDDTPPQFAPAPPEIFDEPLKGRGRVVISSSSSKQRSYVGPDGTNSIFGMCLLDGLHGQGIKAINNQIRILDLFTYLSEKVPEDAGKIGRKQNPEMKTYEVNRNFPVAMFLGGKALLPPLSTSPGTGTNGVHDHKAKLIEIQHTLEQACITHLAKKEPTYPDECDLLVSSLKRLEEILLKLSSDPAVYDDLLTIPLNNVAYQVTSIQTALQEFKKICLPLENHQQGEKYEKARDKVRSKFENLVKRVGLLIEKV